VLRLTPPGSTGTPPRSLGGQEATQRPAQRLATTWSLLYRTATRSSSWPEGAVPPRPGDAMLLLGDEAAQD